jgi:hypothetical protein
VLVSGDPDYRLPAVDFGLAVGLEIQKGARVVGQAVLEAELSVWRGQGE